MNRRPVILLTAALAVAGSALSACASAGKPGTASATAPVVASATGSATPAVSAPGVSATAASAPAGSSRILTEAQLRTVMLTAADLPKPGFKADDAMGGIPDGIASGSNAVPGYEHFLGDGNALFGGIDDGDTQPCAALLNAIGFGRNAKAAKVWASAGFESTSPPSVGDSVTVAAYAPGDAAGIVAGVATAGSAACHQVTNVRITKETDDVASLKVGSVGSAATATAGAQTFLQLGSAGSRIYVVAVAQVGDYVVMVSGSVLNHTGTAVYDQSLLTGTLSYAVAKLSAAIGQ